MSIVYLYPIPYGDNTITACVANIMDTVMDALVEHNIYGKIIAAGYYNPSVVSCDIRDPDDFEKVREILPSARGFIFKDLNEDEDGWLYDLLDRLIIKFILE